MADHIALPLPTLPAPVDRMLRDFTETACHALRESKSDHMRLAQTGRLGNDNPAAPQS